MRNLVPGKFSISGNPKWEQYFIHGFGPEGGVGVGGLDLGRGG